MVNIMMIGGPGLKRLAQFCNQIGTMLRSGIPLARGLEVLKKRGISRDMRPIVSEISRDISAGLSFSQALERHPNTFPPLVRSLVKVGEESGNLDAVLDRLGGYFEFRRQLRNNFLTKLLYPGIQLFLAIIVLSIVSFVFTMLADDGRSAEVAFLKTFFTGFGIVGGLVVLYFIVTRVLTQVRSVQEVMLRLPIIGSVRKNMALALFSWTMEMMTKAGANASDSLRRAFESTDNGAFSARIPKALETLEGGGTMSESINSAGLFPEEFMESIEVGEMSGAVDESYERLAKLHFERGETALTRSATAFAWIIWIAVAGVIIYFIFMFAMQYISAIQGIMALVG